MARCQKRILVYRLGSLGDTVVALPCFHLIRKSFPESEITLLTNLPQSGRAAPANEILGKSALTDEVLSYPVGTRSPRKLFNLALEIRRRGIRTMVYLAAARERFTVLRDRLFFRLCGIRTIVGLPLKEDDFRVVEDQLTGLCEHESLRLARRIVNLGTVDLEARDSWDLLLSPEEIREGERIIHDFGGGPFVAASLGTKMQSKDWGAENWKALLESLSAMFPNHGLLLVGSGEERELSGRAARNWSGVVVNACGKASPRGAASAMTRASVFIGHDSGPMHLAAAQGVPCVAVFSSRGLPGHWFPYGKNHRVVYHSTECRGCNLATCVAERKRCILSITVLEVLQQVCAVLASPDFPSVPEETSRQGSP